MSNEELLTKYATQIYEDKMGEKAARRDVAYLLGFTFGGAIAGGPPLAAVAGGAYAIFALSKTFIDRQVEEFETEGNFAAVEKLMPAATQRKFLKELSAAKIAPTPKTTPHEPAPPRTESAPAPHGVCTESAPDLHGFRTGFARVSHEPAPPRTGFAPAPHDPCTDSHDIRTESAPDDEEWDSAPTSPDLPAVAHRIIEACKHKGFAPEFVKMIDGLSVRLYFFEVSNPDHDRIIERLPLQRIAQSPTPPIVYPDGGHLVVSISKAEDEREFYQWDESELPESYPPSILLGRTADGSPVHCPLEDSHWLIAGGSGSGKSNAAQSIIYGLLRGYPRDHVQVWVNDPKLVTFPDRWKAAGVSKLTRDKEGAIALLKEAYELAQTRFGEMAVLGIEKIFEAPTPPPVIVVLIEEIGQYIVGTKLDPELASQLQKTASFVRAAGIVVMVSTQKIHNDVIPTSVRANLFGRICLRTDNAGESRLIIDDAGGESLTGRGDAIVKFPNGSKTRLQFPWWNLSLLDVIAPTEIAPTPPPQPSETITPPSPPKPSPSLADVCSLEMLQAYIGSGWTKTALADHLSIPRGNGSLYKEYSEAFDLIKASRQGD